MDKLTSKTGGLFNLKEMSLQRDKNKLINEIKELREEQAKYQGVPGYMILQFKDNWNEELQSKGIASLKATLKLLKICSQYNSVHGNVNTNKQ